MKRLFGTDGIRAVAGDYPLDPPTVAAVGAALVRHLGKGAAPRILVGRDTRESGPWMQEAIIAGVRRAGGEAHPIGVIPTPGLAFLTGHGGYQAGVMLSASHNPYRDNGIKIFAPDQMKLSDESERKLEEEILREISEIAARAARASYDPPELRQTEREHPKTGTLPPPSGEERASAARLLAAYEEFLVASLAPETRFTGLSVVLDCANGAASAIAPRIFSSLGATVSSRHIAPDGRNINEKCGALHPEELAKAVVETGADLGLAFDGDADRCLLADRTGRALDGDFILYVEGMRLHRLGALRGNAVVATVMSNLWLEKKLGESQIRLVRAAVGDKYVLDRMLAEGLVLGGEQSGHVIFLDRSRAGDGILTALRIAETIVSEGLDIARLADGIERFPQVLQNVRVTSKPALDEHPEIGPVIREASLALEGRGRVLVRYSGTEPLARVMVEGTEQDTIEKAAAKIVAVIRKNLGAP